MPVLSSNTNESPHVLVIPFPAQGHMIPLFDLIHKLASHGRLTITIFTTPKNLAFLNPLLSAHPSIHTLVLPLPSHPSLPPGVENARDLPQSVRAIMLALSKLHHPLIQWFKSHPFPPQSIISDMFCGWTQRLASDLGIRRLVFSPSAAFALSTMYFVWKELPKRKDENDENEVISYNKLPHSPKYPWWQVSPLYRSYVQGEPESEHFRDGFLGNNTSWGLVVNTFNELEKGYLDYLRKKLGHDRVWAVGPLLPPEDDLSGINQRGGSSSVMADNLLSWLNQHEHGKVVYVCFGSQTFLSKFQVESIASGLEKSGVHFIWSIKVKEPIKEEADQDQDDGAVPLWFEDRTAGRGIVIKGWAPQVLILRHKAVGAFLSHCGWNSVLESLVAGVPLLAWPMSADQFVDATLLVEQLKVAKRVCEGEKTVPNSEELARILAESVSGGSAEAKQALKLQAAALDAIKDGGSSGKDFLCLMDSLAGLAS